MEWIDNNIKINIVKENNLIIIRGAKEQILSLSKGHVLIIRGQAPFVQAVFVFLSLC